MKEELSEDQLNQARSIAQYDMKAAVRYCKVAAARNQMKCFICGSALVKTGGAEYSLICPQRKIHKYDVFS